jgi:hypothetical protein
MIFSDINFFVLMKIMYYFMYYFLPRFLFYYSIYFALFVSYDLFVSHEILEFALNCANLEILYLKNQNFPPIVQLVYEIYVGVTCIFKIYALQAYFFPTKILIKIIIYLGSK